MHIVTAMMDWSTAAAVLWFMYCLRTDIPVACRWVFVCAILHDCIGIHVSDFMCVHGRVIWESQRAVWTEGRVFSSECECDHVWKCERVLVWDCIFLHGWTQILYIYYIQFTLVSIVLYCTLSLTVLRHCHYWLKLLAWLRGDIIIIQIPNL